jgi:hypothetical protein
VLEAAPLGRLQHAEEARLLEVGDGLVGQAAQLGGGGRALEQRRLERLGAGEQLFGRRDRLAHGWTSTCCAVGGAGCW